MESAQMWAIALSAGALFVSCVTLAVATGQLSHAREESRRASRQRRIDALADLLLLLRRFHQNALKLPVGEVDKIRSQVLIAIGRASNGLPEETIGELRTVLGTGSLWAGPAARDAARKVLRALANEANLPWLDEDSEELDLVLAYLGVEVAEDDVAGTE